MRTSTRDLGVIIYRKVRNGVSCGISSEHTGMVTATVADMDPAMDLVDLVVLADLFLQDPSVLLRPVLSVDLSQVLTPGSADPLVNLSLRLSLRPPRLRRVSLPLHLRQRLRRLVVADVAATSVAMVAMESSVACAAA